MSANTAKRYFEESGDLYINFTQASQLLGVTRNQLRNRIYSEEPLFEKVKNPWDRRKVAYRLKDILKLARREEEAGSFSKREKPSMKDPAIKQVRELLEGRPEQSWAIKILATCVDDGTMVSNQPPAPEEGKESTMEILVIGEDVAYVREDVEQIVSRSEDLDPETFDFEIDYVKNRCFGYADETNEECSKYCNIISACAEKRNEMLRQVGDRLDKRDADRRKLADMSANIKKIDEIRNRTLDDWGS